MGHQLAVRDAATVMLVRDDPAGTSPAARSGLSDLLPGDALGPMEIFMLRRNRNSDFLGGAYVFPGGAIDPADRNVNLGHYCTGRTDAEASELLGLPSGGLAYWVAAIRECFEEAGVLLAYDRHGQVLSLADPAVERRFARYRQAVNDGKASLVEICETERLILAVDRIHYFSHWITPVGAPRRYDTRFFVAEAPSEQTTLEDRQEAVASLWVRPAVALERHERGELDLILPTIRNLQAIGQFHTSAGLLEAAAAIESVPTVLPLVVSDAEGRRVVVPGDPVSEQLDEDGCGAEGTTVSSCRGGLT